jgi:hypothetical protein
MRRHNVSVGIRSFETVIGPADQADVHFLVANSPVALLDLVGMSSLGLHLVHQV